MDEWYIEDALDPAFDEFTGQWVVYASRDLYRDGQIIAAKGEKIAGSGFDSSRFGGDLFTLSTASVDGRNVVTIGTTEAYRALVSADNEHEPDGARTSRPHASQSPTVTRTSSRSITTARRSSPTSCGPEPRT